MHYLALEATIVQFDTIPYVEHELEEMDNHVRHAIEHFDMEKVLDEVVVQQIVAENKKDLRKQIMHVYKRFNPNPMVVYTDAFKVHSYITSAPYRSWLPWTLGEQVLFRYVGNEPTRKEMVLCRIIGRDQRALHRYGRYWTELHKREGSIASDFNYPNNLVARRMSSWA